VNVPTSTARRATKESSHHRQQLPLVIADLHPGHVTERLGPWRAAGEQRRRLAGCRGRRRSHGPRQSWWSHACCDSCAPDPRPPLRKHPLVAGRMSPHAIIFTLANPDPEVHPRGVVWVRLVEPRDRVDSGDVDLLTEFPAGRRAEGVQIALWGVSHNANVDVARWWPAHPGATGSPRIGRGSWPLGLRHPRRVLLLAHDEQGVDPPPLQGGCPRGSRRSRATPCGAGSCLAPGCQRRSIRAGRRGAGSGAWRELRRSPP